MVNEIGIHARGKKGEQRAEAHLTGLGWKCIARNVRFRVGEIDLVFEVKGVRGVLLVLVEVRVRAGGALVSPAESLRGPKERRMRNAAAAFLARYRGEAQEVRLDLVSIEGEEVRHYPDFLPRK
jgi:putative endonuclease